VLKVRLKSFTLNFFCNNYRLHGVVHKYYILIKCRTI